MTGTESLILKKLAVHEERMAFLFDMIVALRDKQTDPELRESLNSMKYVLSGRPDCVDEAAALISAQAAEIARLEEAAGEVWDEAYAEGAGDTAGWEKETSHAVLQWLDKEGDGFDINHPDGNTTDAIIQGLYDAKRSGNLTELRQAAARLRSMEEALKPFAVEGRAWRHEFEARGDCRIRIGRNDINEHFATGILMSDFVRANAAISGEGQ